MDSNSYLDFPSGHYDRWKRNVPFGQFRRIHKNCTDNNMFELQANVILERFEAKGYPKGLLKSAYTRAKNLSQVLCLRPKPPKPPVERNNYITTYRSSHQEIHKILQKHWYILGCDPYLKTTLPKHPQITYRRPPTFKNMLAPSRLRQHNTKKMGDLGPKSSHRCQRPNCLCCGEITHNIRTFRSSQTNEEYTIKHHMTCQITYVIYLIECLCGRQYVVRTILKLHLRTNKHRANIQNKFLLHGLSKAMLSRPTT